MTHNTLQTIRGTQDIFGDILNLQNHVIEIARKKALSYCYQEIVTPIFEHSSVFHRTLGDTSDIVSKETYTFLDRDKTSITLRPELTASTVRALISNNLIQDSPIKLFSIGPLFRHERPQKCRYRQFHQASYEFFGAKSEAADAETIAMAYSILSELKLVEFVELNINTIGDADSRARYSSSLSEYLHKYEEALSSDSKIRLKKNPLRILDSKDQKDHEILASAPKMIDFLSTESKSRYEALLNHLDRLDIKYKQNNKLVRGLDYYTDTVFEFITPNLGSQGTVIAGGRYDNLIHIMGGQQTPAIGFACGIERLVALLQYAGLNVQKQKKISMVAIGQNADIYAVTLLNTLRNFNISVDLDYEMTLKKRMQRANKKQADFVILFGDDELAKQSCILKNMKTGVERVVLISDLVKSCDHIARGSA